MDAVPAAFHPLVACGTGRLILPESPLTSAPRWPQTVQTNRVFRSDSRRLWGQQPVSIATECMHVSSPQNT